MNKVMNVPDGWEVKLSSEICHSIADGTHDTPKPSFFGYKLVTSKNLKNNKLDFEDCYLISKEDYIAVNKRSKVQQYDILFGMIGTIGNPVVIEDSKIDFAIKNVGLFRFKGNYQLSKWVYYYISSEKFNNYLDFILSGSSQKFVSLNMLRNLPILMATNEKERNKIAKILSTLDKTIEATQKLIEKEKSIKKGLMHDLLTNGIDSNAKIRTPQTHTYKQSELGLIPEEWDEVQLGTIGKFKNGVNKSKEDFGFGIPFINLQDVFGNWEIIQSDFDLVNANNEELKNYSLEKGDILFIRSSVKPSGVGLTSLVSEDMPTTIYSGFIIRFRSKDKVFDVNYKKYCFHEAMFRQRLLQKSTVSANSNINQESLSSLNILLPLIKEQKQIAKILTTQDKKIQIEEINLAKLKELKKGLMNDLLSGEVRVRV